MILENVNEINKILEEFNKHKCIVTICKYNGGKSSIITDKIYDHFAQEEIYYLTFIDQSKPTFKPRKSELDFGELVENKIIIFDEISDDKDRDVRSYLKILIDKNRVIILTNPYSNREDPDEQIELFRKTENKIIPKDTLFVYVINN